MLHIKYYCQPHMQKLTLDGWVELHSLKLKATEQAAVFDELGVRMCWMDCDNRFKNTFLTVCVGAIHGNWRQIRT